MKIYDYGGKKNISGERIRKCRIAAKLTQSDLTARLQLAGVTLERDSISRIEMGARFVTDYELKVFSELFGVSMDYLAGLTDDPAPCPGAITSDRRTQ